MAISMRSRAGRTYGLDLRQTLILKQMKPKEKTPVSTNFSKVNVSQIDITSRREANTMKTEKKHNSGRKPSIKNEINN